MPRYTEQQAREAVATSECYSEALHKLGLKAHGGNHRVFRKWVDEVWNIPTDHFDPHRVRARLLAASNRTIPIEEVLVENSSYSRTTLKKRLYELGMKQPICELCGQGEIWKGKRMSLILDHINGKNDDNRLENLRIVCPNCSATLDTHCSKNVRAPRIPVECPWCEAVFEPRFKGQKFCSSQCGEKSRSKRLRGVPQPHLRKVVRPPYEGLLEELRSSNYSAVGRKYGVSDNAVRKWIRFYENQQGRVTSSHERELPA